VHGYELWKTNGTAAGTALVKDIVPGVGSSFISELENINGTLIFTVENGDGSRALWRSDGTEDGTRPILTIATRGAERVPASVTLSGSALFFSADDGRTGPELWFIPVSAGIETNLDAPGLAGAPAGGIAGIPISYLNTGLTAARAITLTAALDPRLAYVDDTLGITPSVSGATITWRLPGTGFLDGRDFGLRVRLPQAPLGTRLPVTLSLKAEGQAANDTVKLDVMVAELRYLPVLLR
jgi:ELWxxDGT repeat protein